MESVDSIGNAQVATIHDYLAELKNFKLLAIALAIGLLISLERNWNMRDKADGMGIAGFRVRLKSVFK